MIPVYKQTPDEFHVSEQTYINAGVLTASFEPKDEVCADYIKLEPVPKQEGNTVMPR